MEKQTIINNMKTTYRNLNAELIFLAESIRLAEEE